MGVAGSTMLDAIDASRPYDAPGDSAPETQRPARARRRGMDAQLGTMGPAFSWILLVFLVLGGVAAGAWIWNLKSEQRHIESDLRGYELQLELIAEQAEGEAEIFITCIEAEKYFETLTVYRVYAESALENNDTERIKMLIEVFDEHLEKAIAALEQEQATNGRTGSSSAGGEGKSEGGEEQENSLGVDE